MAYDIAATNTGATAAADAPNAVRKLWQRGVEVFEQQTDFFRPLEGLSDAFPIQKKTDTSKGAGQKITFTAMAGFYGRAHIGDEYFEDGTHFEKFKLGTHDLEVDWVRHGVRYNARLEEKMGMRGEIVQGIPAELGKWLGRLKTKQLFHMFKNKGDAARNIAYINNRASIDAIEDTDTLSYDAIVENAALLQRLNGRPAYVGKDASGNAIHKHIVVSPSDALFSLDLDPDYKSAKIDAGSRGPENLFFKGGYANLRGQVIREYNVVDHDGTGPIGSPVNPRAELGEAIASGTGTLTIKGGGYAAAAALTRVDYFEDFPRFAWRFTPDDVLTPAATDFYVAILNMSGEDKGKFGFYKCNANNGTTLTATERLASATSGVAAKDQVGNVTWDAAVNTDAHPEGSMVILCSANGVPVGATLFLGACAARRGYGKFERQRAEQQHEGGFIRDVYIQSVFGQAPRKDARGRAPGFVWMWHAINYPGLSFTPTLA